MYCVYCENRQRCLDRVEQPLLIGCKSGFPNSIVHTNADRIRAMSDEELAEVLIAYDDELGEYLCSDGKIYAEYLYEEALRHEIEWLKSPSEEEPET